MRDLPGGYDLDFLARESGLKWSLNSIQAELLATLKHYGTTYTTESYWL